MFFGFFFLSGSYLGFSQFFAEATWLLVFFGNQTLFKSKPQKDEIHYLILFYSAIQTTARTEAWVPRSHCERWHLN